MKNKMKEYKIYAISDPDTNIIKYIGVTTRTLKERLYQHLYNARNKRLQISAKCIWSLLKVDKLPVISLVETCTETNWEEREKYWIAYYKKTGELTNLTDGGEGLLGLKLTEEHKRRISLANKNHVVTEETRQKLRLANIGKTFSIETRQKISRFHTGKFKTAEHRKKIGNKHRGKNVSAETREKLRHANIGKIVSEAAKIKMSLARRGVPKSAKHVESMRLSAKKRPVLQISLCGTLIKRHESVSQAAREMKVFKHAIRAALEKETRTAKGFRWKYSDETID